VKSRLKRQSRNQLNRDKRALGSGVWSFQEKNDQNATKKRSSRQKKGWEAKNALYQLARNF